MKKFVYFIVILPILAIGQTPTQSENYIRSKVYKQPTTSSIASPTAEQASQNVSYFDGLGRPIQQVAYQQSPLGKDIVTPIVYDVFGRQSKEYLPYASQNNTIGFTPTTTVLSEQANFSQYTGQVSFSEKQFESSPLNRVLKQAAPGNSWAMGAGKEVKYEYKGNFQTSFQAVKLYFANAIWNASSQIYDISLTQNGNYPINELFETISKNENWSPNKSVNCTTAEYKNKDGRIILKRSYYNGVNCDTYYVYDQYGNLTYVLSPGSIAIGGTISQTILDELCYQYKYDSRNRLVEKKLPGKQWEYFVYDKRDRIVASGPTLSPFTDAAPNNYGWLVTKYDAFNRPILTAWSPATFNSTTRYALQNSYNTATTISEAKSTTTVTVNGIGFQYTNTVQPTVGYHILTINYYDDYNTNLTFNPAISYTSSVTPAPVCYNNTPSTIPKGLSTVTWVRIPETPTSYNAEMSYTIYDIKSRPVRTFTNNYLGGFSQMDTQMEFITGRVNYTVSTHKRVAGSTVITVREDFAYSAQDRVIRHTHKINSQTPQLLYKNDYDELGQLISKKVGGTDSTGATGLQTVNFKYNIRGWLTGINDINNLTQGTDPRDLFAFKINYDILESPMFSWFVPQYNGNISETYWRSDSDNIKRKYFYCYDVLDRLIGSYYQKPDSAIQHTGSYNEGITYDYYNGNITGINRTGDLDDNVNTIEIDWLVYYYAPNSNRLMKVSDVTNSPSGFKDDTTGHDPVEGIDVDIEDDYSYDANGNMTSDQNKEITSIKYNHLNLPTEIVFSGPTTKKINYLYNSIGIKVKKTVTNGTALTHTDYLGGYQYEQTGTGAVALQFFPHAEGYVSNTLVGSTNVYNYVFNYTDHLGNVRLSYKKNGTTLAIVEENNYYPFGLKHEGYNDNNGQAANYKYKYNGKELQDELGLNFYDYGARNYDPAIGRWMNVDPLAETSRRFSPYTYALNNPVYFIDPDGMEAEGFPLDSYDRERMGDPAFFGARDFGGGGLASGNDPPNKYKAYFSQKLKESKHLDKSLNLGSNTAAATVPFALTASAVDGPLPIGEIVGGIALAGAATYDLTQRVYVTYTLRNGAGQVYVGRASGFGSPYGIMMGRYASHHMRVFGYVNPTLDVASQGFPMGYYAIRGREQQLIDFFGGVGSPNVGNSINAIWEYNPNRPLYMSASSTTFGPLK